MFILERISNMQTTGSNFRLTCCYRKEFWFYHLCTSVIYNIVCIWHFF